MNNVIIGTAGHVDHGKTRLIEALTSINTDRLAEERKRGITIDLGYSYIDLPNSGRVGIVDVPGHEKFLRNMLSGVGGINIVLLVVAADELFMPQTKEHLDIITLLGIENGVVALTKIDLIPEDLRQMTISAVKDELKDTILKDASIIPVSSYTKEGIDDLKAVLDETAANINGSSPGSFFMPIDRSFTIKGFGTVVTGSVSSGEINLKDKYMLYPAQREVFVRGIQVHSTPVSKAERGQRCAVNLKDIKKEEISRGQILALKGSCTPTMMLDVKISLLKDSPFSITNDSLLHFYYGAGEYVAKTVLMDKDILLPGDEGYAQLRFKENIVARKDDRFVLRFMSPAVTIAGGVIIDPNPVKKKRNKEETLNSFRTKEFGTPEDKLYAQVRERYNELRTERSFGPESLETIENLSKQGRIIRINNKIISSEREQKLYMFARRLLVAYHKENPYLPGIPEAELKSKLMGEKHLKDAGALLDYWKLCKLIKEAGMCISLYDFELVVPKDDAEIEKRIMKIYTVAGLNPPAYNDLKPAFLGSDRFLPVLNKLLKEKSLIKLDERYIVAAPYYEEAKRRLYLMAEHTNGEITLGEYRDRIKSSRKMALALLEYFDRNKITVKSGDIRRLRWQ